MLLAVKRVVNTQKYNTSLLFFSF